jgi:hypothetical protein
MTLAIDGLHVFSLELKTSKFAIGAAHRDNQASIDVPEALLLEVRHRRERVEVPDDHPSLELVPELQNAS